MDDGVGGEVLCYQIFLSFTFVYQDVAVAQGVQTVAFVSPSHARHNDHLVCPRSLGSIYLSFLAFPIDLLRVLACAFPGEHLQCR